MKNRIKQPALAAASLALLTATSQAAIIFTDTFDSGTGSWFTGGSSGAVVNATTGILANSSAQLSWTPSSSGDITRAIGRSFTSQTVAVGQTIRVTFDYTENYAATTNDVALRVGFYDVANPITANQWSTSGGTVGLFNGYYGFIRDTGTTNTLRTESATDTTAVNTGPTVATSVTLTTTGDSVTYDIVQSTQYKVLFEVTRTSSTQMSSVMKLTSFDGLTTYQNLTASTATVQSNFDTLVVRPNGATLLDNIKVEVIPEPSAALLGGLGLLALLRRRR